MTDKTTVSVATGHIKYHPLYMSIGNVHNSLCRAHHNAVMPIGFLAIPKCLSTFLAIQTDTKTYVAADRRHDDSPELRVFKWRLYHSSITAILNSLRDGMTEPVIHRCPDGHYRQVIYDLASFIADYPEQVLLAGIVQNWCPK